MTATINFWPIIVASVVAFIIGAIWYSPILFGREWMALAKIEQDGNTKGMWKLYVGQFIITLVLFTVMGFFVSLSGSVTAGDGAFLAFLAWVGFSLAPAIGGMLWTKTPFKLLLITEISTLITWIVGAAVIGGWR